MSEFACLLDWWAALGGQAVSWSVDKFACYGKNSTSNGSTRYTKQEHRRAHSTSDRPRLLHWLRRSCISAYGSVVPSTATLELLRSCANLTESRTAFASLASPVIAVQNATKPISIRVPIPASLGG